MELKDTVMISGMPGLYKIIGQRKNGLIVETLDANAKKFATAPTQKISILNEIAIFTEDGDIRLAEVLKTLKTKVEEGLIIPEKKASDNEFKAFLASVVPNYAEDRVYISDIKKLASWWTILKDTLDFDSLTKEEETEKSEEQSVEKTTAKKTTKTATKQNNASPKASTKGKGVIAVTNRKQS
jgi:hypothetical protein